MARKNMKYKRYFTVKNEDAGKFYASARMIVDINDIERVEINETETTYLIQVKAKNINKFHTILTVALICGVSFKEGRPA